MAVFVEIHKLFTIAQLLALVSFSRERKSEKTKRKFKTQNSTPSHTN